MSDLVEIYNNVIMSFIQIEAELNELDLEPVLARSGTMTSIGTDNPHYLGWAPWSPPMLLDQLIEEVSLGRRRS